MWSAQSVLCGEAEVNRYCGVAVHPADHSFSRPGPVFFFAGRGGEQKSGCRTSQRLISAMATLLSGTRSRHSPSANAADHRSPIPSNRC